MVLFWHFWLRFLCYELLRPTNSCGCWAISSITSQHSNVVTTPRHTYISWWPIANRHGCSIWAPFSPWSHFFQVFMGVWLWSNFAWIGKHVQVWTVWSTECRWLESLPSLTRRWGSDYSDTQGLPRTLLGRTLSCTILESFDEAYAQVIYKSLTRDDGVRITLIYKACRALLGRTLRGFGKFQSVHLWTTIISIKLWNTKVIAVHDQVKSNADS